jgi:hypothetical protein
MFSNVMGFKAKLWLQRKRTVNKLLQIFDLAKPFLNLPNKLVIGRR